MFSLAFLFIFVLVMWVDSNKSTLFIIHNGDNEDLKVKGKSYSQENDDEVYQKDV